MGVINITQRSERLGNLGSTSMAHGATSTDIGTVQHHRPGIYAPHMARPGMMMGDAIGAGVRALGAVAGAIGAIQQREEDRKVDDYANAMMDNMEKMGRDDREITDWNAPDRKHLEGQKRGFYLRTGEGTKTLVDEWDKAFADTFRKIGDSIDANDRVRERTMDKLANYRRATVSRLADHQAREYRRMELDSAKGNLATQRMIWKNGRTEVLPDIFAQQERVDTLTLATPETRKANREALAVQLAADFIDNSLQGCTSAEDFDKVEEAVKGGLKDALPDLIADNLPGGSRTVDGEYRKTLIGEVKKEKRLFLAQKEAEEREARQAVGRDFTERELKLRDVPQEFWAEAYEAMGRDPTLRMTDPKRAMAYMDAASEMRTAASKAKEKASADAIKGNEENLARSLATLDLLKMDGSLSQDDANDAQAAIWRKFRALSLGKQLSPSFMRSFETRLSGQLSDQEANAMRKFYLAFGYSADLDKGGEPTATARKDAGNDTTGYYAPDRSAPRQFGFFEKMFADPITLADMLAQEKPETISASDLLAYGDTLLRTLRALGPDMNREGVVEREITRLKTGWMKGGLDKNRDATVRNVMDMQRETRTRWEADQMEERSKDDGGRREDGKTAK